MKSSLRLGHIAGLTSSVTCTLAKNLVSSANRKVEVDPS